jgi:hypothetical protein
MGFVPDPNPTAAAAHIAAGGISTHTQGARTGMPTSITCMVDSPWQPAPRTRLIEEIAFGWTLSDRRAERSVQRAIGHQDARRAWRGVGGHLEDTVADREGHEDP